jgi:hypothetical protein
LPLFVPAAAVLAAAALVPPWAEVRPAPSRPERRGAQSPQTPPRHRSRSPH